MLKHHLPFLLFCPGMIVAAAAGGMPLSEWTASVEAASFEPGYRVTLASLPWVVTLGDRSLSDRVIESRYII